MCPVSVLRNKTRGWMDEQQRHHYNPFQRSIIKLKWQIKCNYLCSLNRYTCLQQFHTTPSHTPLKRNVAIPLRPHVRYRRDSEMLCEFTATVVNYHLALIQPLGVLGLHKRMIIINSASLTAIPINRIMRGNGEGFQRKRFRIHLIHSTVCFVSM